MLTENAVVIAYQAGIATVQCQSKSACGSCVARQGCGSSVLSDLAGEKGTHTFQVESLMPLYIGQTVQIGLAEKSLIFTALLMYIVPLCSLLMATFVCHFFIESELISATVIFLSTAAAFLAIKRYTKGIQQTLYKPVLLKVLGH